MRDRDLQTFLDTLEAALLEEPQAFPGRHLAELVFDALRQTHGTPQVAGRAELPVLGCLDDALDIAATQSSRARPVVSALEPLLPLLPWRQSKGYADAAFNEGHANAVLVGKGGLEHRTDFTIGISLAAPNTAYPMHTHPPEELYLAMAGGEFRHGTEDWTSVATGETFYNTPGIVHAMRASADPLLAIWIFGDR
jgi:quercetin dioxygenase-like cupin family protein